MAAWLSEKIEMKGLSRPVDSYHLRLKHTTIIRQSEGNGKVQFPGVYSATHSAIKLGAIGVYIQGLWGTFISVAQSPLLGIIK